MALFNSNYWGMGANPLRQMYQNAPMPSLVAFGAPGYQEDADTMANVDAALQAAYRPNYSSAFGNWLAKAGIAQGRQNYMQGLLQNPAANYFQTVANTDYMRPWWMASPQEAGRNTMYNRVRWSGY